MNRVTYQVGRYTETYYTGETKVAGEARDISRKVYQRNDIDWDRIDPATGLTNREIALNGGAPYWNDGTKIELHYLLQEEPGPMVEIPASMHDEYYKTLHGLVWSGMEKVLGIIQYWKNNIKILGQNIGDGEQKIYKGRYEI